MDVAHPPGQLRRQPHHAIQSDHEIRPTKRLRQSEREHRGIHLRPTLLHQVEGWVRSSMLLRPSQSMTDDETAWPRDDVIDDRRRREAARHRAAVTVTLERRLAQPAPVGRRGHHVCLRAKTAPFLRSELDGEFTTGAALKSLLGNLGETVARMRSQVRVRHRRRILCVFPPMRRL